MNDRKRSLLAAEFSLGLLTGVERFAAEQRLKTDTAFRDEVEAWQEDLSGLNAVAEVDPPDAIRARIAQQVRAGEASSLPARILGGFLSRGERRMVLANLCVKAAILVAVAIALWLL